MNSPLPLFPTTVVGSLPRPQYLKDLFKAGSRRDKPDPGWQRRMDDAVRFVIGMQEQAGIDIISDGEWRRETYVDVIAEMLTGFRWVKMGTKKARWKRAPRSIVRHRPIAQLRPWPAIRLRLLRRFLQPLFVHLDAESRTWWQADGAV